MSRGTVFILSISADIGAELGAMYADSGWDVVGTYRTLGPAGALQDRPGVHLLPCDVASRESVAAMVTAYRALGRPWDVFISAVGLLDPIGPWTSLDFDAWETSVVVNSTAQLRVLHALFPYRRTGHETHAAFFAGGGTNNPFRNYSAYCVSKISLIKMCELLHDEVSDLNAFIIGPGFLPTKIHQQTFDNPEGAGPNVDKTRAFYARPDGAATYRDIYDCINWCVAQGRAVVGGRNLAAVHDPWRQGGAALAAALRGHPDAFRLRRAAAPVVPEGAE